MSARRWEGAGVEVRHDTEGPKAVPGRPWMIGSTRAVREFMYLTDDEFDALLDTLDQLRHEQPASPEDAS